MIKANFLPKLLPPSNRDGCNRLGVPEARFFDLFAALLLHMLYRGNLVGALRHRLL
ncbi:hypothetical protein [Scytonema sp. NUACC21]